MASGGARGWILDKSVRADLQKQLKKIRSHDPNLKEHVRFLIVHPDSDIYDKENIDEESKRPPHPECYREWYKLAKKYTCLEVRLYHKRTFRLQIEKGKLALVSRYEEKEQTGKPAIVVWDISPNEQNPLKQDPLDNSLYDSFDMIFDIVWDMESKCKNTVCKDPSCDGFACKGSTSKLVDFFEKKQGEKILQKIESEYKYPSLA